MYGATLFLKRQILFRYVDADGIEHLLLAPPRRPCLRKQKGGEEQNEYRENTGGPHPGWIGRDGPAHVIADIAATRLQVGAMQKHRRSKQAGEKKQNANPEAHG